MLSHCVKLKYRVSSRNILEGTVIKLWTVRSGAGFLSGKKKSPLRNVHTSYEAQPSPSNYYRGFFPGCKAAGT